MPGGMTRLEEILRPLQRVVVAWSGGVDSTLLLHAAVTALGPDEVLAVTAVSPIHPRTETNATRNLARRMGVRHHVLLHTAEMRSPRFTANPPQRCYYCKMEMYRKMRQQAVAFHCTTILDGSTSDDASDFRPGERAARAFGVRSPLRESCLTKADIRRLSRRRGLPTWDKPSQACLASRIPYGQRITIRLLRRIERAETALAALGFSPLRVRDHGAIARIELSPKQLPLALARRSEITAILLGQGYHYATLDLAGFRSGSMNETVRRARHQPSPSA